MGEGFGDVIGIKLYAQGESTQGEEKVTQLTTTRRSRLSSFLSPNVYAAAAPRLSISIPSGFRIRYSTSSPADEEARPSLLVRQLPSPRRCFPPNTFARRHLPSLRQLKSSQTPAIAAGLSIK